MLDAPFLLDLLEKAAAWGVLEVAFGGGEPLLFKGFLPLLRELRRTTPLGLGFTTNGLLLTDDLIESLRPLVSEIRVSAYPDNQYRATLRRLRGMQVGLNVLVTPANVGLCEPLVLDALSQGAKNVLLLGYKGPDPSLHLTERDFAILRRSLVRLEGLPLQVDVCLSPHLSGVSLLFDRSDCGAADDFLTITPDRAVQACSFQARGVPFETFEDLQRIYTEMRVERPHAGVRGCTRELFQLRMPAAPPRDTAWIWQAFASNNSGAFTIIGRFCDEEAAQRAAKELAELSRAHEVFLASPEGQAWLQSEDMWNVPTPPVRAFGEAHGLDWSGEKATFLWECMGEGGPALGVGTFDKAVIVHHPYGLSLPMDHFLNYLARAGAIEYGTLYNGFPQFRIAARGRNAEAERALEHHFQERLHNEYACPPWGEICEDPALPKDEDRYVMLEDRNHELEAREDGIAFDASFRNPLAGPLAVNAWLRKQGYRDIEISLLEPLESMTGDWAKRREDELNALMARAEAGAAAFWEECARIAAEDGDEEEEEDGDPAPALSDESPSGDE